MTDHLAWSVRGGDWFGVFGQRITVVLPPTERSRAAVIWELVDAGTGFDEILDALISSGLRALPGFALVGRSAEQTRVLLRGPVRAHFATPDDVVHLDGSDATTWVERTLTGVTRSRIEVAEPVEVEDYLLAGGLVRMSTAEQPPNASALPPAEMAPPLSEPAVAAAAIDPDRGGDTRAGGFDPTTLSAPGIPGQPPAPPVTARPVARLLLPEGESVEVDRAVLVGRAPEVRRAEGTEPPHLVPVPSPHHEISSTHLEVRPGSGADHGTAVATDLGSTNGTLLVQPGLPPEDLKAGVAVQLLPGAVLDLGDGVVIRVVDP